MHFLRFVLTPNCCVHGPAAFCPAADDAQTGKDSVMRKSVGIWNCKRCNKAMAGGAYLLATPAATAARSTLRRLRATTQA